MTIHQSMVNKRLLSLALCLLIVGLLAVGVESKAKGKSKSNKNDKPEKLSASKLSKSLSLPSSCWREPLLLRARRTAVRVCCVTLLPRRRFCRLALFCIARHSAAFLCHEISARPTLRHCMRGRPSDRRPSPVGTSDARGVWPWR